MTKRKPKRKPKRIPNAEEVARCLGSVTTETSGAGTSNVEMRVKYIAKSAAQIAEEMALERGRTIGRIEGLADAFECPWDAKSIVGVSAQSRALLAPILRAEIERLRSKP